MTSDFEDFVSQALSDAINGPYTSPFADNAPESPYSDTERRVATRQRRRDDRSPEVASRMRGEERRMATDWSEVVE